MKTEREILLEKFEIVKGILPSVYNLEVQKRPFMHVHRYPPLLYKETL